MYGCLSVPHVWSSRIHVGSLVKSEKTLNDMYAIPRSPAFNDVEMIGFYQKKSLGYALPGSKMACSVYILVSKQRNG